MICLDNEVTVVFAGTLIVIEKLNCALAPGSPAIATLLLVSTELAVYFIGKEMLSVPLPNVKFNLEELLVPEIVTLPPALPADADDCIVMNSGLPAWFTVLGISSTPAALNVTIPVLAVRPVCGVDVLKSTVPLPEPDVGSMVSQLGLP